ncbi:MAG: hypothetical protein QOE33_482 [Acidobacteriota bacterium]|nr:hypothetical protein [Acidobacteriota bacterium]
MTTPQVAGLPPPQTALTQIVRCAGGCNRSLLKPADTGNRLVLCHSCWTRWLHTMLKLIRVVKEEI